MGGGGEAAHRTLNKVIFRGVQGGGTPLVGDMGGDHHPPRTLNSAMLAPNPHTGAHPGHTKRCFDAILMIFAICSRFFQELATESPYRVHNQAILRGFIRIHAHPSTSIHIHAHPSSHRPIILQSSTLSNIYRKSIDPSSSKPSPILLQSFSSLPPILLQPSNPPPMLLQPSPSHRKSIEPLSNLYRKIYRTSISSLPIQAGFAGICHNRSTCT